MRGRMLGRTIRRETQPRLPARFTQTYTMLAPLDTHRRPATCAEVACPNLSQARCEAAGCARFELGWTTLLHANQTYQLHLARTSGRRFLEKPADDGGVIEFRFASGQQCFESPHWAADVGPCQVKHTVSLERPARFQMRGARSIEFSRPELWAEHWAEHADKVRTERGR